MNDEIAKEILETLRLILTAVEAVGHSVDEVDATVTQEMKGTKGRLESIENRLRK